MRVVVHLSDLHFGAAIPEIVNALAEYVTALAPHVIAVSGDLTQRARREQFRQARAFLARLPRPQIVVPGNHDVPLYNVAARFARPLGGFRRYITGERHPHFHDAELVVAGANTTRSFTIKDGGLRRHDVGRLSELLDTGPPGAARIVVCHHPFDRPVTRGGRLTLPRADSTAVNTLVAHGADVFLTGHLHLAYVGHTAVRYQIPGRSALVVEAGTATSHRGRGEVNSFNVLHVDGGRIAVERHDWNELRRDFAPVSVEEFVRFETGWQPRASSTPRSGGT